MQTEAVKRLSTNGNGRAPTFEGLCNQGRDAADSLDQGRWILGELGAQVKTRYREHSLDEFAKQVGAEKARIYEYSQVWRFYDQISAGADYRAANPMLRYSHYRDAMRLKDRSKVLAWLDKCSDNGYTVEEARVKLQKSLGKPVPPARRAFEVASVIQAKEGRFLATVHGVNELAQFMMEHRSDPDYKLEIVVTYTIKPEDQA